jgi:pimeloyl-ACP methyl ester carboxylesterase
MKKVFKIVIAVFVILSFASFYIPLFGRPSRQQPPREEVTNKINMETITLTTSDNQKIVGDYYQGSKEKGVLLIHMMPSDRKSWEDFASNLNYETLAIDLRGHGESEGGPSGFENFTDEQHQNSILDVEIGVNFLESLGIDKNNIVLIGASIGANLALEYQGKNPEIKKVALLSPGLNYRGVTTKNWVESLKDDQSVFYASSEDDGNNTIENKELDEATKNSKLILYKSSGHGTNMFGKESPDLETEILNWIE